MSSRNIRFISPCSDGKFACIEDEGIKIFNIKNQQLIKEISCTEIGTTKLCELLGDSEKLAIVSGGPKPKFYVENVAIYDAERRKFTFVISVGDAVLSLRFHDNRLYIIQKDEVVYINLKKNPERLCRIYATENPRGLFSIAHSVSAACKIAVVAQGSGDISVYKIPAAAETPYTACKGEVVKAHNHIVVAITLSSDSRTVATASEKGTCIRLFSTQNMDKLHEFRRSLDPAEIYSLTFSDADNLLSVTSSKGTVHVFDLEKANRNIWTSYVFGERSHWKILVTADKKCMASFDSPERIYVISYEGSIQLHKLNKDCTSTKIFYKLLSQPEEYSLPEEDHFFDASSSF